MLILCLFVALCVYKHLSLQVGDEKDEGGSYNDGTGQSSDEQMPRERKRPKGGNQEKKYIWKNKQRPGSNSIVRPSFILECFLSFRCLVFLFLLTYIHRLVFSELGKIKYAFKNLNIRSEQAKLVNQHFRVKLEHVNLTKESAGSN